MSDLIDSRGNLSSADSEWLHLLVGDWQVISDLAFADMVLWLPTQDDDFVAVAQCRPSTAATVHHEDIVGKAAPRGFVSTLREALTARQLVRVGEARWTGAYAIREEAIPVVRAGRTIAVIARETHLGASRTPSRLEINYVESADELCAMIARGEFPAPNAATGPRRGAPRVGDGLIRLNSEGEVLYASPNALSAFNRLGVSDEIVGRSLAEVITPLIEDSAPVDESMPLVLMGRAAWRTDLESRGVSLSLRALPVTEHGTRMGAVLLVRDVSELRRRERELMTKDATIREIHHRVKNNLQTVAALLRLQARRSTSREVREALDGAMRRVATIATVHEALSQTIDEIVDFDDVFGRALRLAADVAAVDSPPVTFVREGTFGRVPASDATSLAVILTELVTNAVEHGLSKTGGTVTVRSQREGRTLAVQVIDDGVGVDPASMDGLGTQIVTTLVDTVLDGSIEWASRSGGGTEVKLETRLGEVADQA
ncbi:sensor histidine kinase [Pseudactinotalea suaedae]|uniref:sensor histidine kinase n=1 Tax=Pseudactinotalea suaedae TaxID=1524924 RepID=UPI0012E19776|nr:PAS domain-containing sensor histidine kinase [Pseudactinotalea suaedae]